MKILSVDTTASPASVAVTDDEKVVAFSYLNIGLKHSETLFSLIDNVLKNSGTDVKSITYTAVNVGPGSFTGVRIGVSSVKGLSFTNEIKCIPVSTLESMAYNMKSFDCYVLSLMDARCNQVYAALFEVSDGKIIRKTEDCAIKIDDINFIPNVCKAVYLVGDGAEIAYKILKDKYKNIKLPASNLMYQNAVSVAMCAADNTDKAINSEDLLPSYLRLPQAERNLK